MHSEEEKAENPRKGFRKYNPLRWITVEPVVVLYFIGSFQMFPSFQALLYRRICDIEYNFNDTICDNLRNSTFKEEELLIQKTATLWNLYCNLCSTLPAIFVAMFMGSWSDTLGRRVTLVIPCIGLLLKAMANLMNSVIVTLPLFFIILGPLLDAFSGGFVMFLMSIYSYIGHVSRPKTRTIRMSIVESLIFTVGFLGTFLSGLILRETSFVFVFSLIGGYCLLAVICTAIFVPRVAHNIQGQENRSVCAKVLSCHHFTDSVVCIFKRRHGRRRLFLLLQQLVLTILMICTSAETDVSYLYLTKPPLSFTNTTYGYVRGIEHLCRGLALITLLTLCKKVFHVTDFTIVIIGLVSKIGGLSILGASYIQSMVYAAAVVAILQGFPAAGLRSMISQMVGQNEQGKVFAVVAVGENIAGLVATLVVNNTYYATVGIFAGLSYYVLVAFLCCGMAIVIWMRVNADESVSMNGGEGITGSASTNMRESSKSLDKMVSNKDEPESGISNISAYDVISEKHNNDNNTSAVTRF